MQDEQVDDDDDDDDVSAQRKGDDKTKADPSTAAVRPAAVAVPATDATASTVREPSGIVPQTTQLREASEVAGSSPTIKKNPAVKSDPSMIATLDNSQIKSKENAEKERSQASGTAVPPVAAAAAKLPIQPGAVAVQVSLTQQNTKLRTGPQQPVAQPGAVAVQGRDATGRSKGSSETATTGRKKDLLIERTSPVSPLR